MPDSKTRATTLPLELQSSQSSLEHIPSKSSTATNHSHHASHEENNPIFVTESPPSIASTESMCDATSDRNNSPALQRWLRESPSEGSIPLIFLTRATPSPSQHSESGQATAIPLLEIVPQQWYVK